MEGGDAARAERAFLDERCELAPANIDAGRRLGLQTIHFRGADGLRDALDPKNADK